MTPRRAGFPANTATGRAEWLIRQSSGFNRKALARFSNACDKQFSSLIGQEDDIVAYSSAFR